MKQKNNMTIENELEIDRIRDHIDKIKMTNIKLLEMKQTKDVQMAIDCNIGIADNLKRVAYWEKQLEKITKIC